MAAPSDPLQCHAVFAALTGSRASLERARQLLGAPRPGLHEAAARAGFASASPLTHRFRAAFGVTPGTWRAGLPPSA
ncbi:helix-turn-helix domain-containing protein [Cupriavidus oxalaticus]|uniref:helix-turn-helix domain-containing protein n=1 Tax=Cupriavidus oxalaticus TaxID=96344 RepID=UPI003F7328A4